MEKLKAVGAIVATIATAGILIWWLIVVEQRIGVKPEVDAAGKVVIDQWARSKDILLVVLPLFTASLAFWVGSQGATAAKEEAKEAKKQLDAVIDVSPAGMFKKAKQEHPDAFSA